jgi:ATP adenylyltransferase
MKKKYLYSPWRLDYILSEKTEGCIFCCKPSAEDDAKHLIIHRSKHCYVILNLYPYNNGHVMVVPFAHVPNLSKLTKTALNDIFSTVQLAESILTKVYRCDGLNIGINVGKTAGAGIDEHIHVHLVPRWLGDCNFMSVVGGERVIPEAFENTFQKLKAAFANHK